MMFTYKVTLKDGVLFRTTVVVVEATSEESAKTTALCKVVNNVNHHSYHVESVKLIENSHE